MAWLLCGCEDMGGLLWNYLNLRLMEGIVFRSSDNQALTTSAIVAEKFGKEHKHVLEAIRSILCTRDENSAFVDSQQLAKMFALTEVELIAFQEGDRES